MPLQATSGAASYDAFGGGAPAVPNYIEDVFSTWLYTGNGNATTRTISNGMDFSAKGGAAFIKNRSAVGDCVVTDTARGARNPIFTSQTAGQDTNVDYAVNSFLSNGFTLATTDSLLNTNGSNYVAWSLLEQPKFFDVVTYTGNGTSQNIAHNLGSVPGCIIVKRTSSTRDWGVYHRSISNNDVLYLNATSAASADPGAWNSTTPTSTHFTVGNGGISNTSGQTYVAYLFAHNAGGFGLSGTDNVISCGSYTGDGGTASTVINLGYEPQWILVKRTDASTPGGNWGIFDNMRGLCVEPTTANDAWLQPNTSAAESMTAALEPTATGFRTSNGSNYNASGGTYIYIAIRRGPMKVPTTGTSVFAPVVQASASPTLITTNFPVDMSWMRSSRASVNQIYDLDRLRGNSAYLETTTTNAEQTFSGGWNFQSNVGVNNVAWSSSGAIWWNWRRAPGFFDEVCYTGTGSARTVAHNLTVAPELIILKSRSIAALWPVWVNGFTGSQYLQLNANSGVISDAPVVNFANINSASFDIQSAWPSTNQAGVTYVAYLFASAPGVSKVGSFTGTGATQVINCGFTTGARFVLIKATSTTGNWLVWDSARGIVAGNDPYLALNSTAAEVTGTDWVDTAASGFELSNAGGNLANSNGVSYVFFAVA